MKQEDGQEDGQEEEEVKDESARTQNVEEDNAVVRGARMHRDAPFLVHPDLSISP